MCSIITSLWGINNSAEAVLTFVLTRGRFIVKNNHFLEHEAETNQKQPHNKHENTK
jgi:hypothetical protein